jgi:hypothetical protein
MLRRNISGAMPAQAPLTVKVTMTLHLGKTRDRKGVEPRLTHQPEPATFAGFDEICSCLRG